MLNNLEHKKLGDVLCQIGVYLITTMTVGLFFTDKFEWWMSLGFAVAGLLCIFIGIRILHYIDDDSVAREMKTEVRKGIFHIDSAEIQK